MNGLTFGYGENGELKGLCKGKKLVYITTAGGKIFHNFGYDYISALAKNFYGIKKVQLFQAEGLDIYGADIASIMDKAKNSFDV